ncbi:uncharacterized protein DS421_14g472180 [Arachis hypogaea]|nr:uncharacterized protein DS421_14g472180 [Arachis hypogaea]
MDGLLKSSSAFRPLSIFHLIHPPDWMFYRSSSHMSKPPETRFNHLFHNGCYPNSLPYIFVPYFIQSRMTTHPSQHLYLCHTQLIFKGEERSARVYRFNFKQHHFLIFFLCCISGSPPQHASDAATPCVRRRTLLPPPPRRTLPKRLEEVEESVKVLKDAAKTRKVAAEKILSALSVIEKAKIDPSGFLETLGGNESPGRTWMLIFTAEKQLKGGRYFPLTAVQRFDAVYCTIWRGRDIWSTSGEDDL